LRLMLATGFVCVGESHLEQTMDIKLVVVGGKQAGKEIPVSGPKFLIGRGSECRLQPRSHMVSRKHCALLLEQDSVFIKDLCSTNGTFLNGERLTEQQKLNQGDRIKIGLLELEVQLVVELGGKRKPRVASIQEAAARTVASAATNDDVDISSWLEEDDVVEKATPVPTTPAYTDTAANKLLDDTVAVPAEADKQQEKSQPTATVASKLQATRQAAASSRSAADDALKQFFSRKRS
jgi:predicted component of type VI protein secretion system